MTTEAEIKNEITRQTARLMFTTDPLAARILATSIGDLVAMLKGYPERLVWVATQR